MVNHRYINVDRYTTGKPTSTSTPPVIQRRVVHHWYTNVGWYINIDWYTTGKPTSTVKPSVHQHWLVHHWETSINWYTTGTQKSTGTPLINRRRLVHHWYTNVNWYIRVNWYTPDKPTSTGTPPVHLHRFAQQHWTTALIVAFPIFLSNSLFFFLNICIFNAILISLVHILFIFVQYCTSLKKFNFRRLYFVLVFFPPLFLYLKVRIDCAYTLSALSPPSELQDCIIVTHVGISLCKNYRLFLPEVIKACDHLVV